MAGMFDVDFGITTWGIRGDKQVWRVSWRERPGMVADVTGPYETRDAFIKAGNVLERLPWRPAD